MLLWHNKQQQLKTSLKKKKKEGLSNTRVAKNTPFSTAPQDVPKHSDNRARLNQIRKTTFQFPFSDEVVS